MRHRIVSLLLTAVLIVLSLGDPSAAAPRSKRERNARSGQGEEVVLVMTGVIGHGSYRKFRRLVSRSRPAYVVLDGPGGVLGEALRIGEEVRRRGLTTVVIPNAHCASACAVVFLSGRTKYMGDGAAVGLHSASSLDGRASPEGTGIMAGYLRSVGVPRNILRQMSKTAPSEIRWLSRAERRALGIQRFESVR